MTEPHPTDRLIDAAVSLAETLGEENAALRDQDVTRALELLERKQAGTAALAAAQADLAGPDASACSPEQFALAQSAAARLEGAAAENKHLLERAIAVQGHMIGMLLRAVPAALPMARYGAGGGRVGRSPPLSLSSRI